MTVSSYSNFTTCKELELVMYYVYGIAGVYKKREQLYIYMSHFFTLHRFDL